MNYLYFFCIIFNFIFTFCNKKAICGKENIINLLTDEVIFIESKNFPSTLTEICEMNFITNTTSVAAVKGNLRLMFVITNGHVNQMNLIFDKNESITQSIGELENYHFLSISNHKNLTISLSMIKGYNAFQGIIISDDWNVGCPLESVSRISPFDFESDANQILYLRSSFLKDNESGISPTKCIWNFVAPENYKFKLLVLNFPSDANATVVFFYGDTVNQSIRFDSIQLYYPYYLETQQLRIIFHNKNLFSMNKFEAYLSIVNTKIDETNMTDAGCEIIKYGNNKTSWKLLDGYPNDAQCSFNLSLSMKNQYLARIVLLSNEFHIDSLIFHFSDGDIPVVESNQIFVFQTLQNGYDKFVLWNFKSDGSYVSEGFQVDFEEIECECSNSLVIVPCIMETNMTIMSNYDSLYCGNLRCNFTIEINHGCPEKYISIKINPPLGIFYDTFYLTSNNQLMLQSKAFVNESDKFITTISPANKNMFHIVSNPSLYPKHFSYIVEATDPPKYFQNITLTMEEPSYILDISGIPENHIVYVELDDELIAYNDTLEVYSNFDYAMEFITFFHDITFDYVLISQNFFETTSKNSVKYVPPSNHLFVYKRHILKQEDNGNAVVFFRALNVHTKNCIFKQNVFDSLNAAKNGKVISMLANDEGECEIILLNRPGIGHVKMNISPNGEINHFWTTSKMSNVKVFRGSQTDELLYEYNKSTNANVNTLMLASGCYTIVVPAAKSIAIDLNVALTNTFTLSSYPYKALWATPNYGSLTVSNTLYSEFLSFNVSQNVTVQIKIKTFDVSSDGRIEFVNSKSNSVFATHAGQQLKFTNDSVKINYYEKNAGHYGVSMEVETLKKQ